METDGRVHRRRQPHRAGARRERPTEVGRLARTLNVMLSRIESAFRARVASEQRLRASEQRLRRFVADASHELRTPIAAISAYAELFGRGASEQKEDLERLHGRDPLRDGPDGAARRRPVAAGPPRRGPADGTAIGGPGGPVRRGGPDRHRRSDPTWPLTFDGAATRSRSWATPPACARSSTTCSATCGPTRRRAPRPGWSVDRDGDRRPRSPWPTTDRACTPEQAEHVFERFYRSDPVAVPGPRRSRPRAVDRECHRGRPRRHGVRRRARIGTGTTVHRPPARLTPARAEAAPRPTSRLPLQPGCRAIDACLGPPGPATITWPVHRAPAILTKLTAGSHRGPSPARHSHAP